MVTILDNDQGLEKQLDQLAAQEFAQKNQVKIGETIQRDTLPPSDIFDLEKYFRNLPPEDKSRILCQLPEKATPAGGPDGPEISGPDYLSWMQEQLQQVRDNPDITPRNDTINKLADEYVLTITMNGPGSEADFDTIKTYVNTSTALRDSTDHNADTTGALTATNMPKTKRARFRSELESFASNSSFQGRGMGAWKAALFDPKNENHPARLAAIAALEQAIANGDIPEGVTIEDIDRIEILKKNGPAGQAESDPEKNCTGSFTEVGVYYTADGLLNMDELATAIIALHHEASHTRGGNHELVQDSNGNRIIKDQAIVCDTSHHAEVIGDREVANSTTARLSSAGRAKKYYELTGHHVSEANIQARIAYRFARGKIEYVTGTNTLAERYNWDHSLQPGYLEVDLPEQIEGNLQVHITDMSGRPVGVTPRVAYNKLIVDLQHGEVPAGWYVVTIFGPEGYKSFKIPVVN